MRITALLRKIHELASQAEHATAIDVDLMLDYTRVLYSDLLEWREEVRKPEPAKAPASAVLPETEPVPEGSRTATSVVENRPHPEQAAAPVSEIAATAAVTEPTLEEYMAAHAGRAIHREPAIAQHVSEPEEQAAEAPLMTLPEGAAVHSRIVATDDKPELAQNQTPAVAAQDPPPVAAPPKPARDIRSMIGINDKYQIMSELFGNDKAAYEQALDVINRAESEQAAFNWLRERLWVTEDHSDAAMIFFDVVRRFKNG